MSPRAKKYQISLIASAVMGAIIGFMLFPSAFEMGKAVGSGERNALSVFDITLDPTIAIIIAITWGILLPVFCISYHKNVYEQEEHAFLWAGLICWYAMVIVAPVWWVLSWADIGPQPSVMGIFGIGMIVNAIVFLWKKFR